MKPSVTSHWGADADWTRVLAHGAIRAFFLQSGPLDERKDSSHAFRRFDRPRNSAVAHGQGVGRGAVNGEVALL